MKVCPFSPVVTRIVKCAKIFASKLWMKRNNKSNCRIFHLFFLFDLFRIVKCAKIFVYKYQFLNLWNINPIEALKGGTKGLI